MPGRFNPVPPAAVARLFAAAEPASGPFRRGLSAFPERPTAATFAHANFGDYTLTPPRFGSVLPTSSGRLRGYDLTPIRFGEVSSYGFGDVSTAVQVGTDVAQIGAATAAGGPIAGGAVLIQDLSSIFSSGSQRDAQRAARANYFGNLAVAGNVGAAQIILGALAPNVSGNEIPMWQVWYNQLTNSQSGQSVLAQAKSLGPYWPVGSTDTVTNYPIMKQFAQNWANAHPLANVTASAKAALGSPVVWAVGAAAVLGVILLRRR